MLILITSGTRAPGLINSFFLLNLLIFSDLVGFIDVEFACVGCRVGALGVVLAVDVVFALSKAKFLLFSFRKYSFFLSL